jgi:rubredoxin
VKKYVCVVCGYIYDEKSEENEHLFHNLPDDYICPECDEGKDAFQLINN